MSVRNKHFHLLPLLGLSLLLALGSISSCADKDTPDPTVRTTVAPGLIPENPQKLNQLPSKRSLKKEKPKPKIESFRKNEPVWV